MPSSLWHRVRGLSSSLSSARGNQDPADKHVCIFHSIVSDLNPFTFEVPLVSFYLPESLEFPPRRLWSHTAWVLILLYHLMTIGQVTLYFCASVPSSSKGTKKANSG